MTNKKDAVEENVILIKRYIGNMIQEHDRISNHGRINYLPKVTFNLKSIQKVIKGRKKFVLDMKTFTDEYDRNKNFNMFSADKIRIIFYSYGKFDIGFDTEISDQRKRFQPIGGNLKKYEEIENSKWYDFASIKLSDICSTEKMFSYESIEQLKFMISEILKEYPEFYTKLFEEKKSKQKTILQ